MEADGAVFTQPSVSALFDRVFKAMASWIRGKLKQTIGNHWVPNWSGELYLWRLHTNHQRNACSYTRLSRLRLTPRWSWKLRPRTKKSRVSSFKIVFTSSHSMFKYDMLSFVPNEEDIGDIFFGVSFTCFILLYSGFNTFRGINDITPNQK